MIPKEENDYVWNVATTLSMKINNDIEEFIVCSVSAYAPLDKQITVNAKKIYEVLEKQIPKKPAHDFRGLYDMCPVCYKNSRHIMVSIPENIPKIKYNFCPYCGQAIEWEDNE